MEANDVDIPELVTDEPTPTKQIDLLSGDRFYALHPDNILGVPYQEKGRFGPITNYSGGLEVLERIDVPMDFVGARKLLEDPLLSTGAEQPEAALLEQPDMARFVEGVNRQSRNNVADMRARNAVRERSASPLTAPPEAELVTFEQIYRRHNGGITQAELEVFVWYKSSLGKPLSRQWINLIEERYHHDLRQPEIYTVPETRVGEWTRQGLLFYFDGKYLPAFLYLSGDIYARKFQLERDREAIVERHGQEVYDQQAERLGAVFKEKYDRRLLIGTGDNNLSLLATSKFAENFFVEELQSSSGDGFRIKRVGASSSRQFGRPDFLKDPETSDHKRDKFERLNLKEGFSYWLIRSSPEIKEAVTGEEIIKYYVQGSPIRAIASETEDEKKEEQSKVAKFKASLQKEGERLFAIFLDTELTVSDKVRLETQWNATYNNFVPVDYSKVPVAFTMAKYYKGRVEELRPEKREAVAFVLSSGTGCLAFDVGVGKTPSSIFTISAFLDAGYSRRPFVCVPNQVYKQFIQEIKEFAPHIPVLEAYNFGQGFIENFQGPDGGIVPVPEGCITVMTYEGLEQIGFTDETSSELFGELYRILDQGGESERPTSKRQKEGFQQRLETLIGRGLQGTLYNIEDFGFDFGCYDEAHKLKKIFTAVKGEVSTDEKGKSSRAKNPYAINSGSPSSIGLKAFMLNQYILKRNNYQNVLLLTATPFTNSPLEIFSMLAMLAYEQLQETDLNNIKNFFDTYIETSTELVINPKLKPEFKQVILGFKNLVSLQTLIRRFINYKTGEDVNVQRPDKYILPYTHKMVGGTVLTLSPEERVETTLPMTPQQKAMMDEIVEYVEGKISIFELGTMAVREAAEPLQTDEEEVTDQSEGDEVSEATLSDEEKQGVRTLRGMSFARNLALSPYLYEFSGLSEPDFHTYIQTSPKLTYIMECIRSVKRYHEKRSEPVSGQVIYMDRGIDYFPLIRQYLIEEIGYQPHEVAIIRSGMPAGTKKGSKEYIKNLFNGELYNAASGLFERVDDADRIKVIIGSGTIKEGINLQRYSTVLYDCWLDWNPTDFQQLSGRIWRQGNLFNSVRIALPLLVDSMDIFIFQKLQEKTARLNTIWAVDGRTSVLKLEEFDPSELKYALVRDPSTVAQLKVIDQQAVLEGEVLGIRRLADRITRIKEAAELVHVRWPVALELAEKYRDVQFGKDPVKSAQKIVAAIQDVLKKQTDKQGRPMVFHYNRQTQSVTGKYVDYSDENPLYKPFWFDEFNMAQRLLNREVKDFLQPRGIELRLQDTSNLDRYQATQEASIASIEERIAKLKDPANLEAIKREVIEEREKNKVTFKPVSAVVADFEKLNYLLEDRKAATTQILPEFDSCPPREDGQLAISDRAIAYLERCIAARPQTRDLHLQEDGTYTPDRTALHQRIEDQLFKGIRCVSRGKPIAVFTGGSPGAGKSHFLRSHAEYLLSADVFHLDADEIREKLPEYEGWNASQTHREAQDIVGDLLARIGGGSCRYDFVYDGTMNKAQKYFSLIRRVKALGYETFLVFVDVPSAVARQRVLSRYQKTGRYVPMSVLEEFHQVLPSGKTRGETVMNELKSVVTGYVVVDGLTGKVKERGGATLPKDRAYGPFWQPEQEITPAAAPALAAEPQEPAAAGPKTDKATIEGYIASLALALKYLEGEDKKTAKERIATYKLSIKYL